MPRRTRTDVDVSQREASGRRSDLHVADAGTEQPAQGSVTGDEKPTRLAWFGSAAGVAVLAAAAALGSAGYSGYVAQSINSNELAFQRNADKAAREHERVVALSAERVKVVQSVTESANTYVQRQTERIPACVQKGSSTCVSASSAALDAQFKLRSAAETARGVLSDEGIRQLEVVESFFANLYAPSLTGVPPDEPVDTEGLHEAIVLFGEKARETPPRP